MGDVIQAEFVTTVDLPCEQVLEAAKEHKLSQVFVVGFDETGELYLAGSSADLREMLWALECAKHRTMKMAEETFT